MKLAASRCRGSSLERAAQLFSSNLTARAYRIQAGSADRLQGREHHGEECVQRMPGHIQRGDGDDSHDRGEQAVLDGREDQGRVRRDPG